MTITDEKGHGTKIEVTAGDDASEATDKGAAVEAAPAPDAAAKPTPRSRGKRAHVTIDGTDRDFDSFDQFVHDEPTIAAMVFLIVSVIFLAPVLAIGLILWYRFRKARMLNETMLKLAEKGVVPPAEALGALSNGRASAVLQSGSVAPIYEQARYIRRRTAWSDLRKGVLIGGVGLALTFYSMLADREPNGFGLVLLFVGLGFVVLWWFEDRQLRPPGGTPPPSSPGTTGNPPSAA